MTNPQAAQPLSTPPAVLVLQVWNAAVNRSQSHSPHTGLQLSIASGMF